MILRPEAVGAGLGVNAVFNAFQANVMVMTEQASSHGEKKQREKAERSKKDF